MPRRLRKLFGLSKVEDEHGHKAPKQTPTVASHAAAPLSAGREAVDGGLPHNTPSRAPDTDGIHDETLPSGRNGTLSQPTAVDSNTIGCLGQTCSYWERAAKQLEDKEPSVFAALQELRRESSRTSKDMPSEISQIIEHHRNTMENKQWSLPFKVRGTEVKIRAQLDNVWKALQTFNAVGSTLASLDPVHAGIPWAGVSFIVQGALNDSAQNAAAMEGLSQISPIVDRYLLMETIYLGIQDRSRHEDFERYLVDLYANILKYQVAAACYCKRSTFSRFLRNLPKVDDWAKMLGDINKKDAYCKGLASVFDSLEQRRQNSTLQSIFQELDKRLGNMQSKMQGNERESARAENARILSWICDYIPGRDHQDVMVHKKMGTQYAHSGQWLLDHHEFLSWRLGEDQGLSTLWVYGSVGTGKTSLVSRVIEWHLQRFQPEMSATYGVAGLEDHVDQKIRPADPEYFGSMAYFYCVRQGQDRSGTDPAVILRSLVRQLAWSLDGSLISPPVRTIYDKWRYERPDSGRLSLGECSGLLTELVSSYSKTTIILDALDECEKPYDLLRELKTIASSSTGQIKLFVSSRPNVNIARVLIPRSKIDIQNQGTSKDMDIFLHTEVKNGDRRLLKGNFPHLEDRLIEVLRYRAQGMFRWAELQLVTFLDENSPFRLAEDVISKLDRLDEEVGLPDLDLVYDEIYQKNTRDGTLDRENVIKTFKFLLYSFVEWNVHDLATAISLRVDGTLNSTIDASYILDICSNFLIVDHSGYVQFAHLSVPEYLKGGRSTIVFSDIDAHAQIAEVCLAYVMSPSAQKNLKKRRVKRPKFRYVMTANGREVLKKRKVKRRKSDEGLNARVEASMNLLNVPDPVPSSQENFKNSRNWDPLGFYDPLGLHKYAFLLCLEHCELASMAKRQEGTLCRLFTTFMSTVKTNAPFLTWIRRKKTFPNNRRNWTPQISFSDYSIKNDRGRADQQDTFFTACIYGFTEILRDMRSIRNLDVDRRNKAGVPGLCLASEYGQLSVVQLLLDEGANSNIRDGLGGFTPLHQAVRFSQFDIVVLLLSRGADASARFIAAPKSIVTPTYSDASGHSDDADDGVDGEHEDNETLLHAVAYNWGEPMQELKMPSIVSLLVTHGLLIDVVDSNLQTSLHIACSEDNLLAVSTLLNHGASPGARDRDGYTPLMLSAKNSSTAAMELTLTKASITDIVRRDNDLAHSVLSLSLQRYKPDAIILLLNIVDLRAARELDTQEGEEFVALLQVLKKIGYGVLDAEWEILRKIAWGARSQRSVTNCLRVIAEKIDLGKLDLNDADFRDKLQNEGLDLGWIPSDTTGRKWGDVPWGDVPLNLPHTRGEEEDDIDDDDIIEIDNDDTDLPLLTQYIYPKFYSLHDMPDSAGVPDETTGVIRLPPPINLSSQSLVPYGLYLIDDGQTQFLWVGREAVPQLIEDVFNVPDRTQLRVGKATLPVLENDFNERVRAVIEKCRDHDDDDTDDNDDTDDDDDVGYKVMATMLAPAGSPGSKRWKDNVDTDDDDRDTAGILYRNGPMLVRFTGIDDDDDTDDDDRDTDGTVARPLRTGKVVRFTGDDEYIF